MKQRLSLAMSLLHDPELIVLDEPMSGLDPLGRALVRDVILEQRRRGRTIVFSTHILSDAEALCDRVGLIAHGRMIDEGAFADVFRREARSFEVLVQPPDGFAGLPDLDPVPDSSLRRAVASVGNLGPAIASLERAGASIVSVSPIRDSLDASFARKVEQAASR
jgi:ABC-2 type transport system ATP-binding protein